MGSVESVQPQEDANGSQLPSEQAPLQQEPSLVAGGVLVLDNGTRLSFDECLWCTQVCVRIKPLEAVSHGREARFRL